MHHDPTFWLIARAAGLTAYAVLTMSVLAGLVLKSRPFARLKPVHVTEIHKTLALTGLGALALHAAALVLDTTVKVSLTALVVPGLVAYRPAAVAAGVIGGWLFVLITVVVLAAQAHRRARLAPPALAHLRTLRPRDDPRHHCRHRHDSAVGARSLSRRHRLGRCRDRVARTRPSRPPGGPERRNHMSKYEITIDPSLCSGYGACVDAARDLFQLDKGGIATRRRQQTDDPAALDAADACPMGAIFVEEVRAA